MNWRTIILLLCLPVFGVGSCALAALEDLAPSRGQVVTATKYPDRLATMAFLKPNRAENFKEMGFDEAEIETISKKINQMSQEYQVEADAGNNIIKKRLEDADNQDYLQTSLCRAERVPIRYAAMRFLVVKDKSGSLKPINFGAADKLEPQEWYEEAVIKAVHTAADLNSKPATDATRMAFAAILSGSQQALINREAPYGSDFLGGGWSWGKVKQKYAGIEERTLTWAALLHLVAEVAFGDAGICNEGG
jgi:hypothetical protein